MTCCQTTLQSLRQRGFRLTPQREMIVQALLHSDQHLTAEQIFDQVRTRTQVINIATVSRTLELLVQQDFVARTILQNGQTVYTAHTHGGHVHLVCRRCGAVMDASSELIAPLAQSLQSQYGFCADRLHISLTGLCQACQADHQSGG